MGIKPIIRVVSIDPGFTMLGVAVSTLDYNTHKQELLYCETFKVSSVTRQYEHHDICSGTSRVINTFAICNLMRSILQEHQPDIIICEAAYLNRFPLAFVSLSLCLNAIESAAYGYDNDIGFYTFDPATIKNANGVKGNSGDKDAMTQSLLSNEHIQTQIDLTELDEHSVDAVCIGFCYFKLTAGF